MPQLKSKPIDLCAGSGLLQELATKEKWGHEATFCGRGLFPPDNRQSGGPDISRNDPRHRHRSIRSGRGRSDGEGSQCGHGPGAHHHHQHRRQLFHPRIADWVLHRDRYAERIPDRGDEQRGSERGHRAQSGRAVQDRPGFGKGRGCRRLAAAGGNDLGGIGRNADLRDDCKHPGQRSRLHKTDLSEPGCGGIPRPDF